MPQTAGVGCNSEIKFSRFFLSIFAVKSVRRCFISVSYTHLDVYKRQITTITEEEEKIREQMKPDFSSYFDYLKNLKNDGSFSEFFKTYDELHAETERFVQNKYKVNLKTFIEEYNLSLIHI